MERSDLRFRGPFVEMFFDGAAERRDLRFLFPALTQTR
jgi:hypothetical protein